jgi:hypothetical protein
MRMAKSGLNKPFTDGEKAKLDKCPNCNELLKRLMPDVYKSITKEDYRLVNIIGEDRLIIHDRSYPGKGVKKMDLRLNKSGAEILSDWRRQNGGGII